MVGSKSNSRPYPISTIPFANLIRNPQTSHKPFLEFQPIHTPNFSYLRSKTRRKPAREVDALFSEDKEMESKGGWDAEDEDLKKNVGELPVVDLKWWRQLLLDPERDNVVAVGLTGALALAGLRVLWQLFMATMAVLITGVKYTFVGVVLIIIVITLL